MLGTESDMSETLKKHESILECQQVKKESENL